MSLPLSILIPTLNNRSHLLDLLLQALEPQLWVDGQQVAQIVTLSDDGQVNGGLSTGAKRNKLIAQVNSEYVVQIDDDDGVASDYILNLYLGILQGVDVITFQGWMYHKGGKDLFECRLGHPYDSDKDKGTGRYRRPPNHICCIKKELIEQVPFPDKTRFEDYEQCLAMQKAGILKTEYHIDKPLYHYHWHLKKPY